MGENDILVTTRYTTEGYDAALSKADRIGQTMLRLSRDLGGIGRAMNSQFLIGVSGILGGIEDTIGAVSELSKAIKKVPALGIGVAGIAGVGLGSAIYDATIGKMQGTSTEKILSQIGELIKAGFNTDTLVVNARIAMIDAMVASNSKFQYDPRGTGALNKQLAGTGISVSDGSLAGIRKAVTETEKLLQLRLTEGDQVGSTVAQVSTALEILKSALAALEAENTKANGSQYAKQLSAVGDKVKATTEYHGKLAQASKTYNAAEFDRKMQLAQLEADITQKRIAAAQSLSSDLSRMDSQYYANRLAAAESFGLESARAEEDHQRQMRQMQQSHDKRVRKLVDSRDALGLEDEIDAFEDERSQAEEEYAVMQSRRNQDYANQMRDMERAFQAQRQERINAYNQQLIDIAEYNKAQRDLIAQQMQAIAKAVMDAFTQAAKDYTAAQNTLNSTNNTANVTQNFGGQSMSPAQYKALTYEAIGEVFGAAR